MSADVTSDVDRPGFTQEPTQALTQEPVDQLTTRLIAETRDLPAWWSLSVLPQRHRDALDQALSSHTRGGQSGQSEQREQREQLAQDEHHALVASTHAAISTLRSGLSARWLATLHMFEWPADQERSRAALVERCAHERRSPPPPLCYRVVIKVEAQTLVLSPAALSLITRLDHEIGRRIGDELDGQRPEGPS